MKIIRDQKIRKEIMGAYNFLISYEALCKMYRIEISACGCCDSPYLVSQGDDIVYIDRINYNYDEEKLKFYLFIALDKRIEAFKEIKKYSEREIDLKDFEKLIDEIGVNK